MLYGKFKGVGSNDFNGYIGSIERRLIIDGINFDYVGSMKEAIKKMLLNKVFTIHYFSIEKDWQDKSTIRRYYITGKILDMFTLPKVTQGIGTEVDHQIQIMGRKWGNRIYSNKIEAIVCYSEEDQLLWKFGADHLDPGDRIVVRKELIEFKPVPLPPELEKHLKGVLKEMEIDSF